MESKFRVYTAGPYYDFGMVYAIVAGYTKDNDPMVYTEWYYFLDSRKPLLEALHIKSTIYKTIDELIDKETIPNLKGNIYSELLYPAMEQFHDYRLDHNIYLQDIGEASLFRINCEHPEKVSYIDDHSSCAVLKAYIEFVRSTRITYEIERPR